MLTNTYSRLDDEGHPHTQRSGAVQCLEPQCSQPWEHYLISYLSAASAGPLVLVTDLHVVMAGVSPLTASVMFWWSRWRSAIRPETRKRKNSSANRVGAACSCVGDSGVSTLSLSDEMSTLISWTRDGTSSMDVEGSCAWVAAPCAPFLPTVEGCFTLHFEQCRFLRDAVFTVKKEGGQKNVYSWRNHTGKWPILWRGFWAINVRVYTLVYYYHTCKWIYTRDNSQRRVLTCVCVGGVIPLQLMRHGF